MATEPTLLPTQHVRPGRFFFKINRSELPLLSVNIVFYSLGSVALLVLSYLLGKIIDALTLHAGAGVVTLSELLILSAVCYEVFYRIGHICEIIIKTNIRARTKKALFKHTTSLSFGYFADCFAGEIAHKIATTADAFERMTLAVTNDFIEGFFLACMVIVSLGIVNIEYGLFMTVWSLYLCIGWFLLARKMNEKANTYALQEARTAGALVDVYTNIAAVKVYGKHNDLNAVDRQIDIETRALRSLGKWDVIMYNFAGISMILLVAGLSLITGTLYVHALITLGTIVFVSGVGFRLYGVVWEMGPRLADFIRARGEAEQNLRDLVVAPAILDGDHELSPSSTTAQIEYRDVTFSYTPDQPVLKDFSLLVSAGEKVGIVGLSGAGKTTFANLLLRFFDAQKGQILFNGKDIRELTQESLRSRISYISQETALFHATIAENVAYGSGVASEVDIRRACRLAYADEFIEMLPRKYESVVGERGIKLSGGQRQRIIIARAILADRPLFLLDEATSALDSDSEHKIKKGLTTLMEGKTVVAIAHRLSTLAHMDRILFFENGTIVEEGSHDELLAMSGRYAELWNMQAGGFLPAEERLELV